MDDSALCSKQYPNALLVLGMHRSGTSLLTGTLEQLGVHLGPVRVSSPYNLKGNRESIAVQRFHDQLLAKNGANWQQPPAAQCQWHRDDFAAGGALVDEIAQPGKVWGFKDPRTIFAFDGWSQLLAAPRAVAMVRPCSAVRTSLGLRGPLSIKGDQAAALWQQYNRELLSLVRRYRIPVLPFPGGETEHKCFFARLDKLCKRWHLGNPKDAEFFDASLINHQLPADGGDSGGLYQALLDEGLANLEKLSADNN
jgi:hypothetical protein